MRRPTILLVFLMAFISCGKKSETVTTYVTCMLKCQDPQIKLKFPFSADTLEGLVLIKYVSNGSFKDTVEVSQPQTVILSTGYDYQVFLPATDAVYRINYISAYPSERQGKCDDVCANAVPGIKVQYNWQPCYYSSELTGKLEYTLYL